VPCRQALHVWRRLRELVPQTGSWPVIVGHVGEEVGRIECQERRSRRRILTDAEKIDPVRWLDERHADHLRCLEDNLRFAREGGYKEDVAWLKRLIGKPGPYSGLERGPWPKDSGAGLFDAIAADLVEDEQERPVSLALLPTATSWHAPAVLKIGGWNECPGPDQHVALLRYWHEKYGAEVVRLTEDVLELDVATPPRKRPEALALAREQYLYCPDVVSQGTDTLDALAATLLHGEAWYFWWD
jgi:hypothetical protein